MTGTRALRVGLGAVVFASVASSVLAAPTDDAVALYKQKRYSEARRALEKIATANPANAAACYYLALALQKVAVPSLDQARTWLEKAVNLAPDNETYLAEYAGVTLLIADRDHSFMAALKGRDAMTQAIAMNPDDIEACEGLMQFYAKAPWPLGDAPKALSLAGDIAKRDPKRGAAAYLKIGGIFEATGHPDQAAAAREAAQKLLPPNP